MRYIRISNDNFIKKALSVSVAILLLSSCSAAPAYVDDAGADKIQPYENLMSQASANEELCFKFIIEKMITENGGMRTNYLDKEHNPGLATGSDVLSESMGLLMLYAEKRNDEELFANSLEFIEEYLDIGKIISYRYSYDTGAYKVNALVDDLRIIKALLMADSVFNRGDCVQKAMKYADRLYASNIMDGYAYDFYDENYDTTNDFITLCYIDLQTFELLGEHDKKWLDVYENMLDIAEGAYISDGFPLFETAYDYSLSEYVSEKINMTESVLTALNLIRIGKCPDATIAYLKDSIAKEGIYDYYSRDGEKTGDTESTAIYSICALIAEETSDEEMYAMCLNKIIGFQVLDESSEVYGAFADAKTFDLYSFDNLMALMAFGQR